MALNINAPNFQGLSARGSSSINIGSPGALGLQALQLSAQEREALRRQAIEQAKLRQADEMALRQQALAQQQMAQQGQQNQDLNQYRQSELGLLQQNALADRQATQQQFGLDQQRLGLAQEQLSYQQQQDQKKEAFEQMRMDVEQMAKKKDSDLNLFGSMAASAKVALEQTKDPAEFTMLRNEVVKEFLDNGLISKEQAEQYLKLPRSQFMRALDVGVLMSGKAKELKALRGEEKKSGNTSITIGPDGTLHYSSLATPSNINKSQEEFSEAVSGKEALKPYFNPPDDVFGLASGKHTVTYLRELAKIIPGVAPDKKDLDALGVYTDFVANANLNIMKTAKNLAGARFSDKDLEMVQKIMPQVGVFHTKTEYMAKMQLVDRFLDQAIQTRKEILKTGKYKLGTEEYDEEFSRRLPGIISAASEPNTTYIRSQLIEKGHSPEKVDALLKQKGML